MQCAGLAQLFSSTFKNILGIFSSKKLSGETIGKTQKLAAQASGSLVGLLRAPPFWRCPVPPESCLDILYRTRSTFNTFLA